MDSPTPTPEFSRPVRSERIGREPKSRHLEANATEREKLAERLGLLALSRLVADVEFRRRSGGRIELKGSFEADLVQSCVVSLAPVPASVAESFEMSFIEVDPGTEPEERETTISLEGVEPPEPVEGGAIDLGEAVTQHLAVAIDPYPRAPEAVPGWSDDPVAEGEARPHPFADLAKLRKTDKTP